MSSRCTHDVAYEILFFLFQSSIIFHGTFISPFLYPSFMDEHLAGPLRSLKSDPHFFLTFPCPSQSSCSSLEHELLTIRVSLNKPHLSCLSVASFAWDAFPYVVCKLPYNLQESYVNCSVKSFLPVSQPYILLLSTPKALQRRHNNNLFRSHSVC